MRDFKKNRKIFAIYYGIGAILVFIFVYAVTAAFADVDKGNINQVYDNFTYIIKKPTVLFDFKKYMNKVSILFIFLIELLYLSFAAVRIIEIRKYLNGQEYGSAEKADIKKVDNLLRSHNENISEEHMIPYTVKASILGRLFNQKDELYFAKNTGFINTQNRLLSRNVRMDIDGRDTHGLNKNILIVGGSGAGKTQYFVRPNLMQMSSSFIVTDPKGEVLKTCGEFLKRNGYNVICLNLINEHEMKKSNHYNPFRYLHTMTDIDRLVNNFIKNTTPPDAQKGEPIWENGEKLLLSAICKYVFLESDDKSFREVMRLLRKAEFRENARGQKEDSELDILMQEIEDRDKMKNYLEKGVNECNHPAVIDYNKVMRGAADTVRSFIVSLNTRMGFMQNEVLLDLLSDDEMNLQEIGAGVGYDGKTKTALFCLIPDSDNTYNSIVGMLYTQAFQELYYYADFMTEKRRLPIHVTFMLDEFANVALPDEYLRLLSTMRSREISSIIIIQNLAQIKKMYPNDEWETIPGNCDTLIFLGGKESSTHKYISEELGEGTYDKKNFSISKGQMSNTSNSFDKYGRKLLNPDEVGRLDPDTCIIMIRGQLPIFDKKINTFKHPFWKYIKKANWNYNANNYRKNKSFNNKEEKYDFVSSLKIINRIKEDEIHNEFLPKEEQRQRVFNMTVEDFLSIDFENIDNNIGLNHMLSDIQLKRNQEINDAVNVSEKKEVRNRYLNEKYFREFLQLRKQGYDQQQTLSLAELLENKYTVSQITETFATDMSVDEIDKYKMLLLSEV